MSVHTVRLFSEALSRQSSFNLIHPEAMDGPFHVLVQLHGFSDDHWSWLLNSKLVRHVRQFPLIVVLPDGGTSRYVNLQMHERYGVQRYEDHIMEDVLGYVRRTFQVRPGPMAIGGLSMGGYGALRLGMKYPDVFGSIWAHSAGLRPLDDAFLGLLDDPSDADVLVHARRIRARRDAGAPTPEIAFDCGVDDVLIEHNRELHTALDDIGLEHRFAEHPGGHSWEYWDAHVPEALARHAQVLGVT